jgi:membrane protein
MSRATDSDKPPAADRLPDENPPESPTKLPKRKWLTVIKRAAKEYSGDNLGDTAAALTYYGILALFPGAIALLSILGFISKDATSTLVANINQLVSGSAKDTIVTTITNVQKNQGAAGLALIIGLATAIWSASGYIAAFMRASNVVYDVPEGRPIWKTLPTRILTTLVILVLLIIAAVLVIFTGPVAEQAGNAIGLGSAAVTVWSIAKWPVLVLIMMVIVGILYWAAPNAKQGFRWVSPGGVIGVLIWIVASALFAFYVANFSSYNKTYGSLAGVVIFLVWVWISNIAILLGAEINAELERARAEVDGLPEGAEPYVELKDTRKLDADELAEVEGSRRHLHPDRGGDAGAAARD